MVAFFMMIGFTAKALVFKGRVSDEQKQLLHGLLIQPRE